MASTKGKCSVLVKKQRDGSYSIGIAVKNVRASSSPDGSLYVLVDMKGQLPVGVEFDGVPLKPFMVLKIYRKFNSRDRRELEKLKAPQYIKDLYAIL